MSQITFDTPVLKIEGLQAKFDVVPASSSLAVLLGNINRALIVQQLHYWGLQGYGVVIDGVRWFYKPIKEWIVDVFPTFSTWQLRRLMAELVELGVVKRAKLFTKHQIQNGDRFWWQPKNQTYYYSLCTEKLQELVREFFSQDPEEKTAETIETSVLCKTTNLSIAENQNTKVCDCSQNNTKTTSTENYSKDQSHPHLPCVNEKKKGSNQKEKTPTTDNFKSPELNPLDLANPIPSNEEPKVPWVEQKVNQYNCTDRATVQDSVQVEQPKPEPEPEKVETQKVTPDQSVPKPRIKTPKGTKFTSKRMKSAPWKDEGQFKRFYRAMIQALPIVANARSPQGLAQVIIRQLRSGIPHTYWDDFVDGLPIGTSTKPEWEVEPGVPYPMFIEYLSEKIIKGNNTQTPEQARNEVFRILSQPRQASAFWGQFKRSVVNVSEQVSRDLALGVSNPTTPVWTRERIEPSIDEAIGAGQRITAANDQAQASIASAEAPVLPFVQTTQLESEDSERVSSSQTPPVSPSTEDPWNEDDQPTIDSDFQSEPQAFESNTPQPTMREILEARGVKGFCKQMPKVSRAEASAEAKAESEALARAQMNRKTNISQMSLNEINELLADPISRKELTPQIIFNDKFDLVTDNLGEVLAVSINQEYLDSGGI